MKFMQHIYAHQNYDTMCTGQELISESNGFEMEAQLQFVSDGVLAFAYAFQVTLLSVLIVSDQNLAWLFPVFST